MITPSQFSVFVTTANTMIRQAYSSAPITYPAFTTTVPMGEASQFEDGWIGRMPKMRVWTGPRIVNEAAPQTYVVVPKPFELTYGIDRFQLDDDKLGIYYPILTDLALQCKRWPQFELRDLLENTGAWTGAPQLGLDGLTFFNTAHPVDIYDSTKGTYCNNFNGGQTISGATVGGALSGTAFGTICEYMMTIKAEDGERLGVVPNMMILPPNLKAEGEYILKNAMAAPPSWNTWGSLGTQVGASDNIFKRFGVDYMVNFDLMSATNWYLADTTKSVKPMRWVQREKPVFTPRVNENDPLVFDNHQYAWGAWGRAAPAWSYSWLMARSGL